MQSPTQKCKIDGALAFGMVAIGLNSCSIKEHPVRRFVLIVFICLFLSCNRGPSDFADSQGLKEHIPSAEAFLKGWFESHGHTDVVVDANGVGVASSPTRLSAKLYGSNQNNGGFVVETEFRIKLASGKEVVEFVAGMGTTKEEAIQDTLANFMLTTFHVVYMAFINPDDPHMTAKQLDIQGRKRDVILGDMYMRGGPGSNELDINSLRPAIEASLSKTQFAEGAHWLKIVYGQSKGKPLTVSVTIDNQEDRPLTDRISSLAWPRSDDYYLFKQFIVIK